ncbi:tetratricopeptide repeat protein [Phormidium nigroviride]
MAVMKRQISTSLALGLRLLVLSLTLASINWNQTTTLLLAETIPNTSEVNVLISQTEASCPNPDPENGCYDPPRGSIANPNTPYIISPFDETNLLNDKPSISWHAVPGVINYTVRLAEITGPGLDWERTVDNFSTLDLGEIKMPYPDDAPALQPGSKYELIVEAISQATQKRIEPGTAQFRMLSKEDIEEVRAAIEKIDKSNFSKEEKAFLLSDIYKDKELNAEMREMLEGLVIEGSQKAKIYRLLGDIYLQQGLIDFAKVRYEMAVSLARNAQDSKELDEAQVGLKETNEKLKKRDDVAP